MDVDATDRSGLTALQWAAHHQREALCKLLIEHKANVDTMTNCHWTLLYEACINHRPQIATLLLKAGCHPAAGTIAAKNTLSPYSVSPLLALCEKPAFNPRALEVLLEYGAQDRLANAAVFGVAAPVGAEIMALLPAFYKWPHVQQCLEKGCHPPTTLTKQCLATIHRSQGEPLLLRWLSPMTKRAETAHTALNDCTILPTAVNRLILEYYYDCRAFVNRIRERLEGWNAHQMHRHQHAVTRLRRELAAAESYLQAETKQKAMLLENATKFRAIYSS